MCYQTELRICSSCHRLLTEGDGRDEIRQRTAPIFTALGDYTLVWLCGRCVDRLRVLAP